jgi:hypothetical protein
MEDLWRVKRSSVDMKDLADLAEYHRFLDRFESDEVGENLRNLLYGDAQFGTTKRDKPEE